MSLFYESFEALANAASMPVEAYIRSLGVQAIEKEIGSTANVQMPFELEDVRTDLMRAVPFGLTARIASSTRTKSVTPERTRSIHFPTRLPPSLSRASVPQPGVNNRTFVSAGE